MWKLMGVSSERMGGERHGRKWINTVFRGVLLGRRTEIRQRLKRTVGATIIFEVGEVIAWVCPDWNYLV